MTSRLVRLAFVCGGALFVLERLTRYSLGRGGVRHYHVEAGVLAFVVVGLAVAFTRRRSSTSTPPDLGRTIRADADASARPAPARPRASAHDRDADAFPRSARPFLAWLAFVIAASAIYWRAWHVGLLSDDFVLLAAARSRHFGPLTRVIFRPIPLLLWAAIDALRGGPVALHGLNIVVHGTNAWLASLVAARWLRDRRLAWFAGIYVLVNPLAVEAVVWCSGVFDLLMTTFVLGAVLAATEYERPSTRRRAAFFCLAALGVLSKETAAIGPVLVLLDAWMRSRVPRALAVDATIALAASGTYGLVRIVAARGVAHMAVTKYVIQRASFALFDGFAAPWRADLLPAGVLTLLVGGALVIALAAFFLTARRARVVVGGAIWMVVAALPVFPVLVLGSDFQGSRYFYLPSVGWAAMFVALLVSPRNRVRAVGTGSIAIAIAACYACATIVGLGPWTRAGALRDRVIDAVRRSPAAAACSAFALDDLPDNVQGAFVFRNGAPEAIAWATGRRVIPLAPPACHFRWDSLSDTLSRF